MIIHWKAVEQNFTVVLFIFQFYKVFNFGKFVNFRLGSERAKDVRDKITENRNRGSNFSTPKVLLVHWLIEAKNKNYFFTHEKRHINGEKHKPT